MLPIPFERRTFKLLGLLAKRALRSAMSMRLLAFTACVLWIAPLAVAQADRVVLLHPLGEVPQERMDEIEEQLAAAVTASGHEPVTEGLGDTAGAPPSTANEMRGVAEVQRATYVVVPRVTMGDHFYDLALRVGYAPSERVEEISVLVSENRGAERLAEVFRALLRPEGVGDDAARLVEGGRADVEADAAERASAESEEERARREAEERARREAQDREAQRRREEEERRAAEFAGREQYGQRAPMMVSGGIDIRPILSHPEGRSGGVMGGFSIRLGYALDALTGLEIRGVFDYVTGATQGFVLGGGAVYLLAPWNYPVFIGGGIEVGYFQGLSGNRVPSFMIRGGATASWRMFSNFYLELVLPELQVLTANGGIVSLGTSIRAGFRF